MLKIFAKLKHCKFLFAFIDIMMPIWDNYFFIKSLILYKDVLVTCIGSVSLGFMGSIKHFWENDIQYISYFAAFELAPYKIRINSVLPGTVNTPFFKGTGLILDESSYTCGAFQRIDGANYKVIFRGRILCDARLNDISIGRAKERRQKIRQRQVSYHYNFLSRWFHSCFNPVN